VESPALPQLAELVQAGDDSLHSWVRDRFSTEQRQLALTEQLRFWLKTAACDLDWATKFKTNSPPVGEPADSYLAKWLPLDRGGHVLVGPRYWGLDPHRPFVGVAASDRPLVPDDRESLIRIAQERYGAFKPGFVKISSPEPVGVWAKTLPGKRLVAGLVGDLRDRATPPALSTALRSDTAYYEQYEAIHATHVRLDPQHATYSHCEERSDLQDLAERGLVFDVLVSGVWAGLLAAQPDIAEGMSGATVVELILDHPYRQRGFGAALSGLLAKAIDMPAEQALFGTIHYENRPAYRAALAAGRVDIGGDILIPV